MFTEAALIIGTFTDVGQTDHLLLRRGEGLTIALNFVGAASITIEGSIDGSFWAPLRKPDGETAATYTSDELVPLEVITDTFIRLNCTDATTDVAYRMTKITP